MQSYSFLPNNTNRGGSYPQPFYLIKVGADEKPALCFRFDNKPTEWNESHGLAHWLH